MGLMSLELRYGKIRRTRVIAKRTVTRDLHFSRWQHPTTRIALRVRGALSTAPTAHRGRHTLQRNIVNHSNKARRTFHLLGLPIDDGRKNFRHTHARRLVLRRNQLN
jgi:hypothetical protein